MTNFSTNDTNSFLDALRIGKNIVFLTGAGVSTDSGIPDFQTIDTNWDFPVDRVEATSIGYFRKDPVNFWRAYRYLFHLKTPLEPNRLHRAIADLEKIKTVNVLTQNIDGLHTLAGSSNVIELHGNLAWAFCSRPSCPERKLISELDAAPRCIRCRKYLRPDVVLFGEAPRSFQAARKLSVDASLLIVAGTSLDVGPVNMLPIYRSNIDDTLQTIWANRDMSPSGYNFTSRLEGPLDDFAQLIEKFLAEA